MKCAAGLIMKPQLLGAAALRASLTNRRFKRYNEIINAAALISTSPPPLTPANTNLITISARLIHALQSELKQSQSACLPPDGQLVADWFARPPECSPASPLSNSPRCRAAVTDY